MSAVQGNPTGAVPQAYVSASLYVGDLSDKISEHNLYEIFSSRGPVASVRVCRDSHTKRSLGYAYVNYHRVEDAERALDTMNFKVIGGRPCRVMWSHRDPQLRKSGVGNVFVKNLDPKIDNKMLYDTFSMFGSILSCKVATDREGKSLGYGFVHYVGEDDAKNAIEKVDGKNIGGEKKADGKVVGGSIVEVKPFLSAQQRGTTRSRFTNLYVKNLPEGSTTESVTELFAKFGEITSSVVKSSELKDKKTGASRLGFFAYVNFKEPAQAAAAIEALNNTDVGGSKLFVAKHQSSEERNREKEEKAKLYRQEQEKDRAGAQGCNLYIKHVHDSVDDERLRAEFIKFGDIKSVRIMRDKDSKKSRGFGFVCFNTQEEATKAVAEMNNHILEGKPLYVAIYQNRYIRQQQLSSYFANRQRQPQMAPQMYGHPGAYQHMYAAAGGMYAARPMMFPQQNGGMIRHQQQPQYRAHPGQVQVPGQVPGRGPMQPGAQITMVPFANPRGGHTARGGRGGAAAAGGRPQRNPQGQPQPKVAGQYNNARPAPAQEEVAAEAPRANSKEELLSLLTKTTDITQKKNILGEQLYPLVFTINKELAGKITGMILEMDVDELLNLLQSPEALSIKVDEAIEVLNNASVVA